MGRWNERKIDQKEKVERDAGGHFASSKHGPKNDEVIPDKSGVRTGDEDAMFGIHPNVDQRKFAPIQSRAAASRSRASNHTCWHHRIPDRAHHDPVCACAADLAVVP